MERSTPHLTNLGNNIIGHDTVIATPYGQFPLIYADWAASGRLYAPIEHIMQTVIGPFVANTHTESNATGCAMTQAYQHARSVIKDHVGATNDDALILAGSGMTAAVTLLQRLLGWRVPKQATGHIPAGQRPVVFVSELEHHSNHTSWLETKADVVVVPRGPDGTIDLGELAQLLHHYHHRPEKVAAVTAASNVTGVRPPIHDVAALMHRHGGWCFVDYTCAAPYDDINMHPADDAQRLDAIYFSPHKFLGGPGSPGVLVLSKRLYRNAVPDRPGGGTVLWTNPWGERHYHPDIEVREDGGTPPFLGAIRAALAIKLKEAMTTEAIRARDKQLVSLVRSALAAVPGVTVLAAEQTERLPVFALTVEGLHYNLVTRLLNDRYGIQARGGCACAGTYGHALFDIGRDQSRSITRRIDRGDLAGKPGFVRLSLHPTMTNATVRYITAAVTEIAAHGAEWARDYTYDPATNEFVHVAPAPSPFALHDAFALSLRPRPANGSPLTRLRRQTGRKPATHGGHDAYADQPHRSAG